MSQDRFGGPAVQPCQMPPKILAILNEIALILSSSLELKDIVPIES